VGLGESSGKKRFKSNHSKRTPKKRYVQGEEVLRVSRDANPDGDANPPIRSKNFLEEGVFGDAGRSPR